MMVVSEGKSSSSNNEGNNNWGMGLFFIFFHNNNHNHNHICSQHQQQQQLLKFKSFNNHHNTTTTNNKRASLSNILVSKTQSTLSICGLLLFTTLLLFTLSSFEPTPYSSHTTTTTNNNNNPYSSRRRSLRDISNNMGNTVKAFALQGLGEVYLKGSKSMSDIIVGHVSHNVSIPNLKSFIRLLMHSGLLSRTDFVLLFPSSTIASKFRPLLKSECDALLTIIHLGRSMQLSPGGLTRYFRVVGEGGKEPLWGRRRSNSSTIIMSGAESMSYGSVIGFDASELDPEESLSGFLDNVPISLRRWACYPMLLGRLRRTFKHIMLVDVDKSLVLSDPFSLVRNRSSESVSVWYSSNFESIRHGRRSHNNNNNNNPEVNAGVIVGGSRGVRRFANAALTEIVRGSIEHKGKNKKAVTESGIVNQLVHSRHLVKSINLMTPPDLIPDLSVVAGTTLGTNLSWGRLGDSYSVVQRGSLDVDEGVIREICLSHKLLFSSVYSDCLAKIDSN